MSTTPKTPTQDTPLLFRISIGGTCLVYLVVLLIGRMIFEGFGGGAFMNSFSDYYYSPSMHNVFVGGLCILGALLMCYRYQPVDTLASYFAGIFAIGVAIFPKAPDPGTAECPTRNCPTALQMGIGTAHYWFSGLFLATIAIMVIVLFTQSNLNPLPTRKLLRNWVFIVVGLLMFVCIATCFLVQNYFLPGNQRLQSLHPVLCFEAGALVLFILAWFVKGQVLLQDENLGLSTLPLILTYLGNVLPDAISSLRSLSPPWRSLGKSSSQNSQPDTSK
jgi:hypothetical protein